MANVFSSDANCKALWKLENNGGVLSLIDSIGGNHLIDVNTVAVDTANQMEGDGCADFEADSSEYLKITNADTDSGFPFREDDTTLLCSGCLWIRPESSVQSFPMLCGRYNAAAGQRAWAVSIINTAGSKLYLGLGYNNGSSGESSTSFGTGFTNGVKYHIGFSFNFSGSTIDGIPTKGYRVRIWDTSANGGLGGYLDNDLTGTFANQIDVSTLSIPDFTLGGRFGGAQFHDGLMDEVVLFNDVLTLDEIDQIRAGTYGAGGSTNLPISGNLTMSGSLTKKIAYHRALNGGI